MKAQISFFLLAALLSAGCNLEPKQHTAQIQKMEDTLFKAFPSVNRVSIEVKNDFGTQVNITLGDEQLYTGSEQERQQVVTQAAQITDHVFAEDKPEKGKLIFVKEENTITVDEASRKTYDLPLKPAP